MRTVVVLLSDKRSGSTIFQKEFCGHPDVKHVRFSSHTYFETHHWLKAAVMLGRPSQLFSGGRSYEGYGSRKNARAYMIDTLRQNVAGIDDQVSDSELIYDGWEKLCEEFAAPVFFEKSPQLLANWAGLSLFLNWIETTSFNVKVVGLVRNPLSVQYSAQELFSTNAELRQIEWANAQRNLMTLSAWLPASQFKLLKYEDIVARPKSVFGDVCNFVGISPHDNMGSSVHVESLEKWKRDVQFTLQLDPSVVQISKKLGYTDLDLENPNKPTKASRRASSHSKLDKIQKFSVRKADRLLRPLYLRLRQKFWKKS